MKRDPEGSLALYDGRGRLGALIQRGKVVDAFDRRGIHLGRFESIQAAVAAIVGSRPVPRVRDQRDRGGGNG